MVVREFAQEKTPHEWLRKYKVSDILYIEDFVQMYVYVFIKF